MVEAAIEEASPEQETASKKGKTNKGKTENGKEVVGKEKNVVEESELPYNLSKRNDDRTGFDSENFADNGKDERGGK